jgi:hypothetical protein
VSDWTVWAEEHGMQSVFGDGVDDCFRTMSSAGKRHGREARRKLGHLTVSPPHLLTSKVN